MTNNNSASLANNLQGLSHCFAASVQDPNDTQQTVEEE